MTRRLSRFGAVSVLGLMFLWSGCDRTASHQPHRSVPTKSPADWLAEVVREAPSNASRLQQWVVQEIQTKRAPQPLPTHPVLPAPKWVCHRLTELLPNAGIVSAWEPAGEAGGIIVSVPPQRSDRITPQLSVKKIFDRRAGPALQMGIRGFRLRREDVGGIALEILAPYGEHVDLVWSQAGHVRIPIPDNKKAWRLEVLTDGFAEWSGPLDRVILRSDGYGEGVFEIRALTFKGHHSAYPAPVGLHRVTMDFERRTAVYAHSPAEIQFRGLTVPDHGALAVGLGIPLSDRVRDATMALAGGVDFEVMIEDTDGRETAFQQRVGSPNTWTDVVVSLAAWAGKEVTLILKTGADQPGLVGLWGSPVVYEPVADPPIMIVYLIDTLSRKHIDLYGYPRPTMPRLKEFAQRGVWFANMFPNSPVTVSSVPDTQLSMPTEQHGVYYTSIAAPLELITLSDVMSAAGFATASFVTNAYAGPRQNMDQGFDEFFATILFFWEEKSGADRTVPIEAVRGWLNKHTDRPAFIYIHTCEPHAPYTPPAGFAGRFDPNYTGKVDGTYNRQTGWMTARTARDVAHLVALYDEEVFYADHMFGRFCDVLAGDGWLDRANLFLIADHGEQFREHGNIGHGHDLYGEVVGVPLVAFGPAITARGRQDIPACLYDIMPTILDIYDLPPPYALSGTSLLPLMRNDTDSIVDPEAEAQLSPERTIIVSHHRHVARGYMVFAVIEAARWKLYYRYMHESVPNYPVPARFELYDLKKDPNERQNILDQHPDVARRLMLKLVAYARQQRPYDRRATGDTLEFDSDQIRDLQSLGYVGDDISDQP